MRMRTLIRLAPNFKIRQQSLRETLTASRNQYDRWHAEQEKIKRQFLEQDERRTFKQAFNKMKEPPQQMMGRGANMRMYPNNGRFVSNREPEKNTGFANAVFKEKSAKTNKNNNVTPQNTNVHLRNDKLNMEGM